MQKGVPRKSNEILGVLGIVAIGVVVIYLVQLLVFPFLEKAFPILVNYDRYLKDAFAAVIIFGFAVIIVRIIHRTIEVASQKSSRRNYRGLYTIFRAIIYGSAIAAFLAYLGISLEGALIGGTVGGLVISFALQNTISNLLSGLLLASAGIIKPKDNISFFSWLFNNPVVGEVKDVKLLTVSVETIDGNITELPNTALLGSSQFTNLTVNGKIRTVQTVALPVDANIKNIMDFSRQKIESSMKDFGVTKFESYFYTKNFNSNVIKVIFEFNDISMFNPITDLINRSYEAAYWEMKNMAPQGNNILLGFPVDVPIDDLIKEGDNILRAISQENGITQFSSYFFTKNSSVNTIKVVFSLKNGASYDSVAHSINSSYEKAYTTLKAKQSTHSAT